MSYDIMKMLDSSQFRQVRGNGYDPAQVDSTLKAARSLVAAVLQEHQDLRSRVNEEVRLVGQALVSLEKTAAEREKKANTEAARIEQQARQDAEAMLRRAQRLHGACEQQVRDLLDQFYVLARKHVQALETDFLEMVRVLGEEIEDEFRLAAATASDRATGGQNPSKVRLNPGENGVLLGRRILEDVVDGSGEVLLPRGTIITPERLDEMIQKGFFGALVAALEPTGMRSDE